MRDLLTVIKYTIKENVTKKAFIISTIILMIMIVLIFNIPNIINIFVNEGDEEPTYDKIVINDKENIFGEYLKSLEGNSEQLGYEFIVNSEETDEQIKQKIENNELDGLVEIFKGEEGIELDYFVKSIGYATGYSEETTIQNIISILKNIQLNKELMEANVSPEIITSINSTIDYEIESIEESNDNYGVAMVTSFILFFAVYLYGYSVSTSVSSEKTSRVMETLITSTTPTNIIVGKTVATGIVGLLQLIAFILVAVISYNLFIPEGYDFIATMIQDMNINLYSIVICLIYFVLGFGVFAFLSAVTGATVSKVEDLQSAQMPVSIISVLSFYMAYFTLTTPDSVASKVASVFPFTAPFSMPGRIMAGAATAGEIVLSIFLLLVMAALLAYISIKLYSSAVLHYGKRLKIVELFKMSRENKSK